MRIAIAYTAVTHGPIVDEYCSRFVATYREYPAVAPHDLFIICNGGPLHTSTSLIFTGMSARMFPRQNDEGYDITGYIAAAKGPCADYDMMLCLGESNYFHRAGWLLRLVQAWEKHGPGMYSPYSSNSVRSHMNTTAFCCPPSALRNYPRRVACRMDRYEFEHGVQALWRRIHAQGMQTRMVTWDGEWEPHLWRMPKNILWRGDQSNLLMHCNHSDGYENANAATKAMWAARSDAPFK